MTKIIVITGQTATGKTNFALKIAKKNNGELVNCDSRQIYKYLDIITGKDIIGQVWLYDIVDPKQFFSSFDYVIFAAEKINEIIKRGKTPILVGGTGLYLKHLLNGFDNTVAPNWQLRKKLEKKSVFELQQIIKSKKPGLIINNSDFNNPRRLIRKIEIFSSTSSNTPNCHKIPNIPIEYIGLKYKNKQDLIKNIKLRVYKRLDQGAIIEVKNLLKKGYTENDPGLKTIGYQQLIQYLKGGLSLDQAINQWINKEIQYAKRQLTYLKKYFQIKWIEI